MAEHPIVPSKTAMLFFDTLNAYLHPADPARQANIDKLGVIPRLQRINEASRAAQIPVFYAQADHRPDGKDFVQLINQTGRINFPPATAGSSTQDVIPEIAPQPGDYLIKKHRWSTFYQTHFELSLRTAGVDTLMIAGGAIEVGVASTAYSARDRDFNLIILRDACTGRTEAGLSFFMDDVFPAFARVMTVDQAIALIRT